MSDPKLVLVMIVKNESKIIERCFDSVKSSVDSIVISDTGSSDNTVELMEQYLEKNNITGKIYKDEWKNFGHNRSKSIKNAQEWLRETNADLSNTYLLTIDADMIFRVLPTFKKSMLLQKDSWCIQQKNPGMTYYNKRLFRSSLAYRCIGVTHEYWGCDDKDNDGKLDDLYIDDIGDGGAKADKFERDIRLLTQGLIDEPKNERYFFYLAQSYSDNGKKLEAIEWYKKRIEAGGWHEEVFMAYLRIGDIYNFLNQYENSIHYWSLAYNHLPSRSETLYRIIHRFRLLGKNHLGMLYLKTALPIEYPKDQVLFIEHPIYQYRLLEELSICGFYTKERPQALVACEYLLLYKNSPPDLKAQCYSNLFFFLTKIQNTCHQKLEIKADEPYLSSSSSFLKTKKGYVGNVRAVNYSINRQFQYSVRDTQNKVRTKNYWVTLDELRNVQKQYELLIDNKCVEKRDSHIKGLEDLRICKVGDDFYGLAVTFEYGKNNHPSVVLCIIDKNDDNGHYHISNVFPTTFKEDEIQKNWAPFCNDNKLYAIYCHQPLTIVEIDKKTGSTTVALSKESTPLYNLGSIRGSASPIKLRDGSWLVLIHEVLHRDTRKYFHRFMLYDSNWNLREVSTSFYFSELFVEFCLSITETDGIITIFYSKEDNTTEAITVPFSSISWLPNDIRKWISDNF